jgi:cytochrome P450
MHGCRTFGRSASDHRRPRRRPAYSQPVPSIPEHVGLGSSVTLGELEDAPYAPIAALREQEPVAWMPVLDGWLVTRRDLCIEVMRDAERFTVDDPRFSTAQVVGPSMLSLDGDEHRRHRDPFAAAFRRPQVMERFGHRVRDEALALIDGLRPHGQAEIRRDLAGPLAVRVVAAALELLDVEPGVVLGWYDEIVGAVDRVSAGGEIGQAAPAAVAALDRHVGMTIDAGGSVLSDATATLSRREIVSNAAVMMFGGIETSEGMTTSLFWHVLTTPGALDALRQDTALLGNAVEESLRLEPAAGRVDRYATVDVQLGGSTIRRGDLVIVSLTGANRDPATYPDPDRFDLRRENARTHLAFAQGPHACVGLHLARLETQVALETALDRWPNLRIGDDATPPSGVVFRKPKRLPVAWDPLR